MNLLKVTILISPDPVRVTQVFGIKEAQVPVIILTPLPRVTTLTPPGALAVLPTDLETILQAVPALLVAYIPVLVLAQAMVVAVQTLVLSAVAIQVYHYIARIR